MTVSLIVLGYWNTKNVLTVSKCRTQVVSAPRHFGITVVPKCPSHFGTKL